MQTIITHRNGLEQFYELIAIFQIIFTYCSASKRFFRAGDLQVVGL